MTELTLATLLSLSVFFQTNLDHMHDGFVVGGDEINQVKSQENDLLGKDFQLHVEIDGRFYNISEVSQFPSREKFLVQVSRKVPVDYDDTYIEYYHYDHVVKFLDRDKSRWEELGYSVEIVGESLQGRDLYGVFPKEFDPNKKTIVMFGRHHGDEGTANWIIEGFVESLLSEREPNWLEDFQLVLYPMVNPDGAEMQTRYNANQRDLNRWWREDGDHKKEAHEVGQIHSHLEQFLTDETPVMVAWDMHGSFTEDFIFRVKSDYKTDDFYQHQSHVIHTLGEHDPWQAGNFRLSNGDPGMCRIVLINAYGINALTHETPRDIRLDNTDGRSLETLKEQGVAVYDTIFLIYGTVSKNR